MASKRIFITGGSGCIGHYMADLLIQRTNHELFFLIRNPAKVQFDLKARPGIHLVKGDMLDIEEQAELLATMDVAILAANAWGGAQEVFDVNVARTTRLMKLLDPKRCQKVLYFSTASILGRDNQPLREAKQFGTGYIRSKYDCLAQLHRLEIASKITVLFPTLVFGGSETKPYSHLSGGLPDIVRWVGLIRFLTADASFHYLHAYDIAQVATYLVDQPLPHKIVNAMDDLDVKKVILGNPAIQVDDAVKEICGYFGKSIWFNFNVSKWLANFLIRLFRIQVGAWDRFCIDYRHFCYKNPVSPAVLGLTPLCPTLSDVLQATGLKGVRSPKTQAAQPVRPMLETVEPASLEPLEYSPVSDVAESIVNPQERTSTSTPEGLEPSTISESDAVVESQTVKPAPSEPLEQAALFDPATESISHSQNPDPASIPDVPEPSTTLDTDSDSSSDLSQNETMT